MPTKPRYGSRDARVALSPGLVAFLALTALIGIVVAVDLLSVRTPPSQDESKYLDICINEGGPLAKHDHPKLTIMIDSTPMKIPRGVGISSTCTRPIHTHDETGTLHVESPSDRDYTLGDFFKIWGVAFSSDRIFGHINNSTHSLRMTVGGSENSAFDKFVLGDGQEIVLTFGRR